MSRNNKRNKRSKSSNGSGYRKNGDLCPDGESKVASSYGRKMNQHVANIFAGVVQFGCIWLVIIVLMKIMSHYKSLYDDPIVLATMNEGNLSSWNESCEAHWWYDPTVFNISAKERKRFHPVVRFPKTWIEDVQYIQNKTRIKKRQVLDYQVMDFREGGNGVVMHHSWEIPQRDYDHDHIESSRALVPIDDHLTNLMAIKQHHEQNDNENDNNDEIKTLTRRRCNKLKQLFQKCPIQDNDDDNSPLRGPYSVGRYNENRKNMYDTVHTLFSNDTNIIDSYNTTTSPRTVHMGIDIYAPAGNKVYAFTDGTIHAAGYNPAKGDYGHVIVLEHAVGSPPTKLWALYGHLGKRGISKKIKGQKIRRGSVLGFVGNKEENGGWENPHVHFQIARAAPEGHDMPGVVAAGDRQRALWDYPDPRLVLGPLY
mmetsp:Transcript_48272/g.58434  ORF Transcript_48272/g.58434 Transcript_48272/m.58434 type:complete len:425 (+) Transcript_48272:209-1483(+)|eukprot:CAMPEP_0172482724 /NCGR_PEP_ID=MMETSP1066-20121228/9308_1 /TAXON_ID=671091 /ORGANISM="Coscinodiscus wailesii, Strain CCMP2513" /LENGTH=424 /DNA_ID=CAMNT_0013246085 /DNA_START=209 /DNA_END=1483 /DNA_ORIENTATION=-